VVLANEFVEGSHLRCLVNTEPSWQVMWQFLQPVLRAMFGSSTKSCSRFFVIIASLQNLDFRDIKGVLRIVAISATICNTLIKFEALPRDLTTLQVHHTCMHKVLPSYLSRKFGVSCCFLKLPLVFVRFVSPRLQRRIVSA
jgi:hypothetical protein